jgi:hypothetical protein
MSSAHEPSQLLEPSNLLEPLDLTERQLDLPSPSAGSDVTGTSQRGFTRTTKSKFIPRPARGHARSPLKAILMIAGAFACFGAGMAMPQLQKFTFDDVKSWPTIIHSGCGRRGQTGCIEAGGVKVGCIDLERIEPDYGPERERQRAACGQPGPQCAGRGAIRSRREGCGRRQPATLPQGRLQLP